MTQPPNPESIKWPRDRQRPKQNESLQQLSLAIDDYLLWMKSVGYARKTLQSHQRQLNQFLCFSKNTTISWQKLFTSAFLEGFKKLAGQSALTAINGLSRYLFGQDQIPQPSLKRSAPIDLPKIYEDYLAHRQTYRQATAHQISNTKRVIFMPSSA